ncbi:MAG: hypothetical protein OEU09_09495 [Rhodospirillales bacterium]|nr:hypothetical protein [Rhodospirillales bacterium]MDH3790595.1 hypothetical protein [Rhodospirillales bacterium]MDH3911520.1 hypothetical protein [Rhodospirillales bacterium]MDH3965956.1 hypothetical protein [Rhodospirillales bacterium]
MAVAKQFNRMQAPGGGFQPILYGKKGKLLQNLGVKVSSTSTYMTCANYAEIIMHAAGIKAPFSLGLQSGFNIVTYNKGLFETVTKFLNIQK